VVELAQLGYFTGRKQTYCNDPCIMLFVVPTLNQGVLMTENLNVARMAVSLQQQILYNLNNDRFPQVHYDSSDEERASHELIIALGSALAEELERPFKGTDTVVGDHWDYIMTIDAFANNVMFMFEIISEELISVRTDQSWKCDHAAGPVSVNLGIIARASIRWQ
jgi:hypothetical protein